MKDYKKYIDYLKHCNGRENILVFDEDWKPIGPEVRKEMQKLGLTYEAYKTIYLFK